MPTTTIVPRVLTIDPVTRLEGHLRIDVEVDIVGGQQQVVNARSTGTLFRGFEQILVGRDPWDAVPITQRICGVCPVSHGLAASLAVERASGILAPDNARVLRNLVLGANYIQSHVLHFYHLSLADFAPGPAAAPWAPSWQTDQRLSPAAAAKLFEHYVEALDVRRQAHEMGAQFGGKLPHVASFIPGGITATPSSNRVNQFKNYLDEMIPFIEETWLSDIDVLAAAYPEYAVVGRGPGNLLSFGVFELDRPGTTTLFRAGRVENGSSTVQPVDLDAITESVAHSWYDDRTGELNPANGQTVPKYPKGSAYSWLKSPRHASKPYECGPLARMWVQGQYREGISTLHRHEARAREALLVARAMQQWIGEVRLDSAVVQDSGSPSSGFGVGLTEAPRGALGHWLRIVNKKIASYQVVTPTCWNASPRDAQQVRGPIEEALVGTPVINVDEPVEVLRVVHSFDPCLACAVHVARPGRQARPIVLEG